MKIVIETRPIFKNALCSWWGSFVKGNLDHICVTSFLLGAVALSTDNILNDDLTWLSEIANIRSKL